MQKDLSDDKEVLPKILLSDALIVRVQFRIDVAGQPCEVERFVRHNKIARLASCEASLKLRNEAGTFRHDGQKVRPAFL